MDRSGIQYFCICFLCGSENICVHREPDLLVWWLLQLRNRGLLNQTTGGPTLAPKPIPAGREVTEFPLIAAAGRPS